VPVVGGEVSGGDGFHFTVGDFDAAGVDAGVVVGVDGQTGAGGGCRDQVDGDFMAGQGLSGPVQGDMAEQPMLDLVPFAGARRHVTDRDGQASGLGQGGQFLLP
jgi:hypothetical protein